jgi:hypothetical protein
MWCFKTKLDESQTEYIKSYQRLWDALIILINDTDIAKVDGKMITHRLNYPNLFRTSALNKKNEKNLELLHEM